MDILIQVEKKLPNGGLFDSLEEWKVDLHFGRKLKPAKFSDKRNF